MNTSCVLTKKNCVPCRGGVPPLKGQKVSELYSQLKEGWQVIDEHHLEKNYIFPDFKSALLFTLKVGNLSEYEGHHPDIHLSYGKVKISIWTHKIDGLSESDFILAAKCDEL
jgi:4a-hydroxytetrahydrobiopterin dehydratase